MLHVCALGLVILLTFFSLLAALIVLAVKKSLSLPTPTASPCTIDRHRYSSTFQFDL
jgi:hypothetical protein